MLLIPTKLVFVGYTLGQQLPLGWPHVHFTRGSNLIFATTDYVDPTMFLGQEKWFCQRWSYVSENIFAAYIHYALPT